MQLVDTHCHLVSDQLKDDLAHILERAKKVHVTKIINIAYNLESSRLVLEQLKISLNPAVKPRDDRAMLYGALGIQPHDVGEYTPQIAEEIQGLILSSPRIVAIGEIGLDAYTPESQSTLKLQKTCFEHFLNIACTLELPVVVHVRNTHIESYELIAKYSKKGLTGVIHCFTGTQSEAAQFLDCGFYISFAGIVTFKNAQNLALVSEFIPADRILIETDSPYLAPTPMRGKVNEPSYLPNTCAFIAQRRGVLIEDFAHQTYLNSHQLFKALNSVNSLN